MFILKRISNEACGVIKWTDLEDLLLTNIRKFRCLTSLLDHFNLPAARNSLAKYFLPL